MEIPMCPRIMSTTYHFAHDASPPFTRVFFSLPESAPTSKLFYYMSWKNVRGYPVKIACNDHVSGFEGSSNPIIHLVTRIVLHGRFVNERCIILYFLSDRSEADTKKRKTRNNIRRPPSITVEAFVDC